MPAASAASAATRLIVSNDPCLASLCPATRPPWPTWVEAGSSFALIVLAVDDFGVLDPSYTGTVTLSTTDPQATLPPDYTFTLADSGRKMLNGAVLRSPGAQRVAAADLSLDVLPGSFGLTVYQIGSCIPSVTTLCLARGRFQVDARWRRSTEPTTSTATSVSLTSDTGYFWFFSPSNIEVVVKVLNACSFDAHWWVFAGGLTSVEVTLTVVDSEAGTVRSYTNLAGGAFQPIQDTVAFDCP